MRVKIIRPAVVTVDGSLRQFQRGQEVDVAPDVADRITRQLAGRVLPEAEPAAPATDETPDFSGMTKPQIDDWAAAQGIEIDGRKSKADMIADVEAALADGAA